MRCSMRRGDATGFHLTLGMAPVIPDLALPAFFPYESVHDCFRAVFITLTYRSLIRLKGAFPHATRVQGRFRPFRARLARADPSGGCADDRETHRAGHR